MLGEETAIWQPLGFERLMRRCRVWRAEAGCKQISGISASREASQPQQNLAPRLTGTGPALQPRQKISFPSTHSSTSQTI
jgi:hypothetical protein